MKWFSFIKKKNAAPVEEAAPSFPFLIPRESVVHGSIDAPVPCRLEGCVEGDIMVKGTLIVSEVAEVWGNITCDEVIVYGKVWRNITCTQKARICAHGYVEGTISAAELEIDDLATVKFTMLEAEVGEEEEIIAYDTAVSSIVSPSKVLVSESTWF
jgi:cytoskeletal protein CcmA (bactofilin family)